MRTFTWPRARSERGYSCSSFGFRSVALASVRGREVGGAHAAEVAVRLVVAEEDGEARAPHERRSSQLWSRSRQNFSRSGSSFSRYQTIPASNRYTSAISLR